MTFLPGNKAAVGNKGPTRPRFITQSLISQLNQITRDIDSQGKPTRDQVTTVHLLVKKMIALALDGDTTMIKEIFDRVEGKPVQGVVTAEAGTEAADAMLKLPDNFKDLPQSELVRLYREAIAEGARAGRESSGASH